MRPGRRLLRQFSHYFGGGALSLLLGLITFPILTRALSREAYGILSLATTTLAFAVALAKTGLSDGIIRFFREYTNSAGRITTFISTVVARGALFAVVVALGYLIFVPSLIRLLGVEDQYLTCFRVTAAYLLARPLNLIVLNILRARGSTVFYTMLGTCTKALGVGLGLVLLLFVVRSLVGYFVGLAIAEILESIVLFSWLFRNFEFRRDQISPTLAAQLIRFGFPLLLTELSYLLLAYVDRYMIIAYQGEDALGLYSVAYNLPNYANELIAISLSYAVVPIYVDLHATQGPARTGQFLSKALYYYSIVIIPMCVGYFAVAQDLLVTLASHKYAEAGAFSPYILIGLALLGLNSVLGAGLYLQRKSQLLLAVMAAALAVKILTNIVLLPRFGGLGAALSTMAAGAVSAGLTALLSSRYLSVSVPVRTVAFYAATSAVMYALIFWIDTGSPWWNLSAKILAGGGFFASAVLWRETDLRLLALRLARRTTSRTSGTYP